MLPTLMTELLEIQQESPETRRTTVYAVPVAALIFRTFQGQ